ncbi:MAG: hypothetical protein PVG71_09460 [Anaerolineae bacterium]|jgi:hypothetical protein
MTYNPGEVAAILQRLKSEVRNQRLRDELGRSAAVAAALEEVKLTRWVNPHQPIAWPSWPEAVWPKVVAFVQKVVRRMLRWYINPIVEEQNRFNQAVAEALDVLTEENAQLRAELRIGSGERFKASSRE